MRRSCSRNIRSFILLGTILLGMPHPLHAQGEASSDNLLMSAQNATTWVDSQNPATNVVLLEGNVVLELDRTRMTADRAVLWLTPARRPILDEQEAHIALIGNATLDQPGQLQRSGDRLIVTASVRGTIRITAEKRAVGNREDSDIFKAAAIMRPLPPTAGAEELDNWLLQPRAVPSTTPATQPAKRRFPIAFSADRIETIKTTDGAIAVVVTGNVKIFQRRGEIEMIELQADRAVLFTPLTDMRELQKGSRMEKIEDAITATYLEGDVRIVHTPPARRQADQRLLANRAYYDFETDRAILTDAVMHTIEPQRNMPIVMRAQVVRQLSMGEFRAEKAKLTQSSFFTPSYHIGMKQAYIRQVDTGDPRYGSLTLFNGKDTTFNAHGVPFFYLPAVGGSFTERGGALRDISISSDTRFGTGIETKWGLFETLGRLPPKDLDVELALDYFTDRGPAFGLNGKYGGGFISEMNKQPWAFDGRLDTYAVLDHGVDELGRRRINVQPDDEFRYRIVWEHQHFFPDYWQVQLSAAFISDPSFQEQWFRNEFWKQRPLDTAIYLKRQKQTEAFTLLYSIQPNDFVTTPDLYQELAEVERTPEIGYHRIGESIGRDNFTFFSDNTLSGLRFQTPGDSRSNHLINDLGFRAADGPGLPSYGRTGTPSRLTWRGDFRQEIDYPLTLGRFKVVPYLMARYTAYSRSPEDSANDRLMVGGGVRITTAFWKVDDSVHSELWDLHRLRHVIEPEINLFTSGQTLDRNRLFQYDESIDGITDISAIQIALRQRWQTKRGGPGRWRSVDFFTLNIEGNFFANQPRETDLAPVAFRGLYFMSEPETSIPRNNVNADATWRLSDTTAILADAQYNLDESTLATASIGLAAARDVRLAYFIGCRYIDSGQYLSPLAGGATLPRDRHSVVVTGAVNYELTPKYIFALRQSFDFGERERVLSYYSIIRRFDRWNASVTFRVDYIGEESGVFVNIWPEGLGTAATSAERLQQVFR